MSWIVGVNFAFGRRQHWLFCAVALPLLLAVSCGVQEQAPASARPQDSLKQTRYNQGWSSTYYCPLSGIVMGTTREYALGTTMYQGAVSTVRLRIVPCEHERATCTELLDSPTVPSRSHLKLLVPAPQEKGPLIVDGGYLWWTRIRSDPEIVEFRWAEERGGKPTYGYSIVDHKLESFWGFDFTPDQAARVGEACHLLRGDGLLGLVEVGSAHERDLF